MRPLREIRARVGDAIEIMIEGHGFFQLPSRCVWPMRSARFDLSGWKMCCESTTSIRWLTFDDSRACRSQLRKCLLGRSSYLQLLKAGAADYIMIDPTWAGGISETRRIIDLAQAHNVPATMHDCTGPLTMFSGLHCAVASANVVLQETVRAHIRTFYERLIDRQPVIENGCLLAPTDPGLGTTFHDSLFESGKYQYRCSERS